jgi:hypothetical protein
VLRCVRSDLIDPKDATEEVHKEWQRNTVKTTKYEVASHAGLSDSNENECSGQLVHCPPAKQLSMADPSAGSR